jgi:hypothetical protein
MFELGRRDFITLLGGAEPWILAPLVALQAQCVFPRAAIF